MNSAKTLKEMLQNRFGVEFLTRMKEIDCDREHTVAQAVKAIKAAIKTSDDEFVDELAEVFVEACLGDRLDTVHPQ